MPLSQYPERDYIVVAPTDCIMNPLVQVLNKHGTVTRQIINNPLQYDTVLDVKGIPMSMDQLLHGIPEKYKQQFVGGSGQSCVLMPSTYHHFHSPVDGKVIYADVVKANTLGTSGTFGVTLIFLTGCRLTAMWDVQAPILVSSRLSSVA